MPSFLIIGAAKAGSTSLARFLTAQPDVFMPNNELRFFNFEEIRSNANGPRDETLVAESIDSLESYKEVFAAAPPGRILGERSNTYLYTEAVPRRIHEALPGVRLLAILRDPAERAFSQFLMNSRYGSEPESDFGLALDLEAERIRAGWSFLFHYTARSLYGEQLERYVAIFPPERLKVVLFEDLVRDPVAVGSECARFVGSTGMAVPEAVHHNPTIVTRSTRLRDFLDEPRMTKKLVRAVVPAGTRERVVARLRESNRHRPTLPKRLRRRLVNYFEADISKTEELIGRDLSAWRS